jgi:hypothetical protein
MFSVKFHLHDDITLVESVSGMWRVLLYCLDIDVLSTENSYCVWQIMPEIGQDGGVLLTPHVPLGVTRIDDDDDWHVIELCVVVPSLCELSFVFSFMGRCVKSLLRP